MSRDKLPAEHGSWAIDLLQLEKLLASERRKGAEEYRERTEFVLAKAVIAQVVAQARAQHLESLLRRLAYVTCPETGKRYCANDDCYQAEGEPHLSDCWLELALANPAATMAARWLAEAKDKPAEGERVSDCKKCGGLGYYSVAEIAPMQAEPQPVALFGRRPVTTERLQLCECQRHHDTATLMHKFGSVIECMAREKREGE